MSELRDGPSGILDRTLAVFALLAAEPRGLPLSVIADRLAIPRSATHRLLTDLADRGFVRQERDHGAYLLTARLVSLAFTWLAATGVTDIAQPILDALARQTGELVRLSVVDGPRLTWIAKAQGARAGLRYDPDNGQEARLVCSASGFAWLACLPDAQALALVERQGGFTGLDAYGPSAPRDAATLLAHLHATRARGYSITIRTFADWMAAMAAPVRHPGTGEVRGVVSIAGPDARMTEAWMHDAAPHLLNAAAELAAAAAASPALRASAAA